MAKTKRKKTDTENKSGPKLSYIVGIGASAGGLKALQQFFNNMQSGSGIAFVVIQHLSVDYKSMMPELLTKYTDMPICRAEDNTVMKADHIYLITPRKNVTTIRGRLFLAEQPERHGLKLPIDVFFRSLAEDQGDRAIGVILSGTGSDGTRGLRAIKAEGGTVFVQNEKSAEFDGMPRCAIATGLADFILPPGEMPARILNFINQPAENIFGIERARLRRMKINSRKFNITDIDDRKIPQEEEPLTRILATEKPVKNYIMCVRRPDKQRVVLNINANPTFNAKKEVDGAVF